MKLLGEGCTLRGVTCLKGGLVLFDVVVAQALCSDDALRNRTEAFITQALMRCLHLDVKGAKEQKSCLLEHCMFSSNRTAGPCLQTLFRDLQIY